MSDLDEISMMLGRIANQNDEHTRQLSALFHQLDGLKREHAEIAGVAKEAIRQSAETSRVIREEIRPYIDDFRNLKAKGAGVLAVIAVLGGGAAMAIERMWVSWK